MVGHLLAGALANVLGFLNRPVYRLAQLAVLAAFVMLIVEAVRRWHELDALGAVAGAAGALVLLHLAIDASVRGLRRVHVTLNYRRAA